MAIVTPPTIDPAPSPAPQRGDRTTFSTRVDAFVTWISAAVAQFAALASNVFNNATEAFNSATSAQAQANAAIAAVGSPVWTSGTYAVGDVRWSPINGATYRCYVAVSGSTDPSADAAHWVRISGGVVGYLHVRDQKASGTVGGPGTAGNYATRVLNTVVGTNSIAGSSLSSNKIVLPAGAYEVAAIAPGESVGLHKLSLYNVTDSADILVGTSESSPAADTTWTTNAGVRGKFTLEAPKTVSLRHWVSAGNSSNDFGRPTSNGQPEVYAEIQLWKEL
jgi:hypothetical protein